MSVIIADTEERVFTPSRYQQAVFDALLENGSDLQVNAVAGSGKTTTLIEALNRIPPTTVNNTLLAAFSKDIADALQKRAPLGVTVRTNHSIGFSALVNYFTREQGSRFHPKVDKTLTKYKRLIASFWLGNYRNEDEPVGDDEHQMFQLVHFTRVTLTNPNNRDDVMEMALTRELELPKPDRMLDALPHILNAGRDVLGKEKHPGFSRPLPTDYIDFDDMIWLPFVLDAQPKRFDLVMVDEAQDLSAAQLDLLLKCRANGGRMLMVGDPRQAIYGFAGADFNSWNNIKEKTGARQLPLSVCYRCPTLVVDMAKAIVPEIEAAPNAPAGKVEDITTEQFMKNVSSQDMVLCRVNAPLISTAFKLITDGKPAKVRGREIGQSLIRIVDNIVKQIAVRGETLDFTEFLTYTQVYRDSHETLLRRKKDSEEQIASLHDQVDSLEAVYSNVVGSGGSTLEDLTAKIENLFTDTENGHILLTSIHKAKGLEAERVFLLRPDKLPHPMATTPAALAQEENLRYVAITRSLGELYIVRPETAAAKTNKPAAAPEPTATEAVVEVAVPIADSLLPMVPEAPSPAPILAEPCPDPEVPYEPTLKDLLLTHEQYCDLHHKLTKAMVAHVIRTTDTKELIATLRRHRLDLRRQTTMLRDITKRG